MLYDLLPCELQRCARFSLCHHFFFEGAAVVLMTRDVSNDIVCHEIGSTVEPVSWTIQYS